MRRFILALVVALIGFVGTSATQTSANGATTITIADNNSRSVAVTTTRQPTVAQYILIYANNLGKIK
jgi:hypothetical protein